MKRTVLVFGLIAGLIVTVMMLYSVSKCYTDETWEPSVTLGYATMIVAFSLIYVAVRNFRDKYNGGVITFGKAFRIGLYITLVASAMYVVVWLIDYYVFVPDFMEHYTDMALRDAAKKGEDIAKTREELNMYREWYKNPLLVVLLTFMEIFPVGLVISLIAAAIVKKKPEQYVSGN